MLRPQSLPQPPPDDLVRYADVVMVDGPVSANVADGAATMAMTHWYPASHAILRERTGVITVEPGGPPFIEVRNPPLIDNPIIELHDQFGSFLADHFAGAVPTVTDAYAAPSLR